MLTSDDNHCVLCNNFHRSERTYLLLSNWLISLSMMVFSWVYFVPTDISLFNGWIIFDCVYYHIFYIQSSVSGHLGWFRILAIVHYITTNMGLWVTPIQIAFLLGTFPGVGWLGCMVDLFTDIWRISILASTVVTLICIPTSNRLGYNFLHIFTSIFFPKRLYNGHSHRD